MTSSLQQVAGGVGAVGAGLVVTQASPLQHYNVLGYLVVALSVGCVLLMYRVSLLVARKQRLATQTPAVTSAAPVAALVE